MPMDKFSIKPHEFIKLEQRRRGERILYTSGQLAKSYVVNQRQKFEGSLMLGVVELSSLANGFIRVPQC